MTTTTESTYRWATDAASGTIHATTPDDALARLIADNEWGTGQREARDLADGAWLRVWDADGLVVVRRGER